MKFQITILEHLGHLSYASLSWSIYLMLAKASILEHLKQPYSMLSEQMDLKKATGSAHFLHFGTFATLAHQFHQSYPLMDQTYLMGCKFRSIPLLMILSFLFIPPPSPIRHSFLPPGITPTFHLSPVCEVQSCLAEESKGHEEGYEGCCSHPGPCVTILP